MASSPVQVNLTLTLPPVALHMPLAADPRLTTTVSPPVAHWGPGPVHVRLISCELREGQVSSGRWSSFLPTLSPQLRLANGLFVLQDSEELVSLSGADPPPASVSQLLWVQKQPPCPWLLIHLHGGGFVAQTSKSHEVKSSLLR